MRKITLLTAIVSLSVSGLFAQPTFCGMSWVRWDQEPGLDNLGYANFPYANPVVNIKKAPTSWSYEATQEVFNETWALLGDSLPIALNTNSAGGDIFDLGTGNTYGAAWKGIHDGSKLYILAKFWDANAQADEGTRSFEIMTQPTSIIRHEPTFIAAADSTEETQYMYENQAYARVVELGGGKSKFADGVVSEFSAAAGLDREYFDGRLHYASPSWTANEHGLLDLALATHFWSTENDGTINAIYVMSFDGALAYPEDPTNLDGNYISTNVSDTIAFDIKSNTKIDGKKVEYYWAANANNGYASNYYSGHLILDEAEIGVGIDNKITQNIKVYSSHNSIYMQGIDHADVRIYNVTGSLIMAVSDVSNQIDINHLPDGIYVVTIKGVNKGYKIINK